MLNLPLKTTEDLIYLNLVMSLSCAVKASIVTIAHVCASNRLRLELERCFSDVRKTAVSYYWKHINGTG